MMAQVGGRGDRRPPRTLTGGGAISGGGGGRRTSRHGCWSGRLSDLPRTGRRSGTAEGAADVGFEVDDFATDGAASPLVHRSEPVDVSHGQAPVPGDLGHAKPARAGPPLSAHPTIEFTPPMRRPRVVGVETTLHFARQQPLVIPNVSIKGADTVRLDAGTDAESARPSRVRHPTSGLGRLPHLGYCISGRRMCAEPVQVPVEEGGRCLDRAAGRLAAALADYQVAPSDEPDSKQLQRFEHCGV